MKKILHLLMFGFVFVSAKAQDDPLKEYVGTYKFPDGSTVPTVDVKIEGGILIASSSAGSSPLEKLAKDTFSIVNYNGMMYFIRDANKIVVGMKFEVQDVVQEGKKESFGSFQSYGLHKSNELFQISRENLLARNNRRVIQIRFIPISSAIFSPGYNS